ncbi:Zinc finger protein 425 [Nymphon striatum]|nr:Zinc finger protein 425 [Nymphon striatum]
MLQFTDLMVRKESIACPVCNKMFQYLSTMKHHYKHKHTKSERISCNICNRSFVWSNDLTKHMNLVHRIPKEFQCCICEKFYHSSGKIVQHHNLVHPHEELSYRRRSRKTEVTSCPVCNKVFLHRSSMRNHYLHKHCEKKEICCEICNMKFGWKNELYRHMDNVHNIPKDFQCSICGRFYPFIRKSFAYVILSLHKHCEKKEICCEICNMKFGWKNELYRHMDNVHNIPKDFQCSICGRFYHSYGKVYISLFTQDHVDILAATHVQVATRFFRPYGNSGSYPCPSCNKMFQYRHTMLNHQKHKHGSKKTLISCTLCNMTFKWSSNLTNHMDNVHKIPKEFQCKICEKFYHSYGSALRHHVKVHPGQSMNIQHLKKN